MTAGASSNSQYVGIEGADELLTFLMSLPDEHSQLTNNALSCKIYNGWGVVYRASGGQSSTRSESPGCSLASMLMTRPTRCDAVRVSFCFAGFCPDDRGASLVWHGLEHVQYGSRYLCLHTSYLAHATLRRCRLVRSDRTFDRRVHRQLARSWRDAPMRRRQRSSGLD